MRRLTRHLAIKIPKIQKNPITTINEIGSLSDLSPRETLNLTGERLQARAGPLLVAYLTEKDLRNHLHL